MISELNPRVFGMLYGKIMDFPPVVCRVRTNRKVLIPLPETKEEKERETEKEREKERKEEEGEKKKSARKKEEEGRFLQATIYFPRGLEGVEGVDVSDYEGREGQEKGKEKEMEEGNKEKDEKEKGQKKIEEGNEEGEKKEKKEKEEEKEEKEEKKEKKEKEEEKEIEEKEKGKEKEEKDEKEIEGKEKGKEKEEKDEKEQEKKGKEQEKDKEQKQDAKEKEKEGGEKESGIFPSISDFVPFSGSSSSTEAYPTIIIRTPYGRGLMDFVGQRFCERGYIVLIQDCRGTGESDGEFDPGLNEERDGKATLRWVRSQPWFQQCPKIGTWGPSYLGMVQLAVLETEVDDKEAPPDAMVPIMTSSNFRNVIAPIGGGLHLSLFCRWHYITHSQMKRRGHKESFLKEGQIFRKMDSKCDPAFNCPLAEVDKTITKEETYLGTTLLNMCFSKDVQVAEEFWAKRNYNELLRRNKKMPNVLLIAGWYDIFLDDQICDYLYMSSVHPENVRLIVGGWHHFDIGAFSWGMSEGLAHFEATLKDKQKKETKQVKVYVMGKEKWVEMDKFPPPIDEFPSLTYFLSVEGEKKLLSPSPADAADSSSKYTYDPSDPTPSIGGREFHPKEAGQRHNNTVEKRADTLVFTTHTLKNRVDVLGHIKITLFMKYSTPSVDIFVRLCSVGSTVGRSKNMSDGYLRLFQNKEEEGKTHKVDLFLSPCACSFHKGDKIRIQVASGAHPRFHPNNGTGDPFSTDLEKAEVEIFHDASNPSLVILNHQDDEE